MPHVRFHYETLDELRREAEALGAFLPLDEDMSPLLAPLEFGPLRAANRVAFQPMEGTDGTLDGAPGELTRRRYLRFAQGGPGLIWFEAVATLPRVRASAHQLYLTSENVGAFAGLVEEIKSACLKKHGYEPVIIMQATNSGRYSKPRGVPEPLIAYNCPPLEDEKLPESCIVSDDDLKRFEEAYVQTARLCRQAGFDGMDVKCCHRYLACELLSAYTRPGAYGGRYENRTRFLKNCYRAARAGAGEDFVLTSRLNAWDGFVYPYGFGEKPGEDMQPDREEPIRLISELRKEFSIPIINITMGNPYRNPHVNRPYDKGGYVPNEHPLEGLSRMMRGVSEIQRAVDIPVIGSAFSYPRQFSCNLAAGMLAGGHCAMAGFGRQTLAYPDFLNDVKNGGMRREKCCVSCGGCAQLLRQGIPCGCVVRDREVYKL